MNIELVHEPYSHTTLFCEFKSIRKKIEYNLNKMLIIIEKQLISFQELIHEYKFNAFRVEFVFH